MGKKEREKFMAQVADVVERVGYDKAPREICKLGLAVSQAEARRYVKYLKIQNGDKKVRH